MASAFAGVGGGECAGVFHVTFECCFTGHYRRYVEVVFGSYSWIFREWGVPFSHNFG